MDIINFSSASRSNRPTSCRIISGLSCLLIDAIAWAKRMADLGAGEILLTSMDRDGTRDGYDLVLTRAVADAVPIPVVASGGVGTLEHVREGLASGGADAALAASIFHDGHYTVAEVKRYLLDHGVCVRPPEGD